MTALTSLFGFVPGWIWAALLTGSVLHGCWLGNRRDAAANDLHALQTHVAQVEAQRAERARKAEAAARAEEARRNTEREKTIQEAQDARKIAENDAALASAAADGLRMRVAALVATAGSAAGNPQHGGSGPRQQDQAALDLLAGVLTRVGDRATELAAYADSLRIAGVACERSYDALAPQDVVH